MKLQIIPIKIKYIQVTHINTKIIIIVMEYASNGQLIEWDDDESKFIFVKEDQ